MRNSAFARSNRSTLGRHRGLIRKESSLYSTGRTLPTSTEYTSRHQFSESRNTRLQHKTSRISLSPEVGNEDTGYRHRLVVGKNVVCGNLRPPWFVC